MASRGSQKINSDAQTTDAAHQSAFGVPEFVGTYNPDGRFSKAPRRATQYSDNSIRRARAPRSADLPPWVKLRSVEQPVENLAPPAHATALARPASQLGQMRDNFLTAIYGHESVLRTPTHVVTDSKGRLIVADPGHPAVHVLYGTDSFRITAGDNRRLEMPSGVAVDGDDNIYVSDAKLGVVQVFDPLGHFVRSIGLYRGESMFDYPTCIAIDGRAERLYVLDGRIDQVVILDLKGNVIARVGGHRHRDGNVKFVRATEVAAGKNVVAVLDDSNSRVQILDRQGNLLKQIRIRELTAPPEEVEMGLAMDRDGRIFVSNIGPGVQVFDSNGNAAGSIGQFGIANEHFTHPAGIWIDEGGRLYVSDTNTSRIQVFRTAANTPDEPKAQAAR